MSENNVRYQDWPRAEIASAAAGAVLGATAIRWAHNAMEQPHDNYARQVIYLTGKLNTLQGVENNLVREDQTVSGKLYGDTIETLGRIRDKRQELIDHKPSKPNTQQYLAVDIGLPLIGAAILVGITYGGRRGFRQLNSVLKNRKFKNKMPQQEVDAKFKEIKESFDN